MLKSYDEMRKVDVMPYTEKRDGVPYLPWNVCVDLLHQHGAEKVYFVPVPNPKTGHSLYESESTFKDKNGVENKCYETVIKICIDDAEYERRSPVMNGSNPVKANSMSQQRLWNSMTRSFVKGVAIYTGLGFSLWLQEEEYERKAQYQADFCHDIMQVQNRVFETLTAIQKRSAMTLADIAEQMNKTEDELRMYLKHYSILNNLEKNLNVVLQKVSTGDAR